MMHPKNMESAAGGDDRGGRRGGPRRRGPFGAGFPDGPGPRGPRGRFGRPGGWVQGDQPPADDAGQWFTGRLPKEWFSAVDVTVDKEEILVVGSLNEETLEGAAAEGRLSRFREETRVERMAIAEEAQARYGRTVSWGARLGDQEALFTHLAVPVMTRLRQPERRVLDTLVDSGVARSRADALAWSVRLVGEHAEDWLGQLRTAMAEVDKLRSQGPEA